MKELLSNLDQIESDINLKKKKIPEISDKFVEAISTIPKLFCGSTRHTIAKTYIGILNSAILDQLSRLVTHPFLKRRQIFTIFDPSPLPSATISISAKF